MGKIIDRVIGRTLTAVAFYLIYVNAFGSIPLACGLAFISCLLARRLAEGLRAALARTSLCRRQVVRRRIAAGLERWARMPEAQARAELWDVLGRLYPDEVDPHLDLVVASRPAGCSPLRASECFALWQSHRDAGRLLIVCTGRAEPEAFALAQSLDAPRTRLLDGRQLSGALLKRPELVPEAPSMHSPRRRMRRRLGREYVRRSLFMGLSLLAGYALLGRALYLAAGLALLGLAGIGLRRPRRPERLFS